jgi:hypothetical protein
MFSSSKFYLLWLGGCEVSRQFYIVKVVVKKEMHYLGSKIGMFQNHCFKFQSCVMPFHCFLWQVVLVGLFECRTPCP